MKKIFKKLTTLLMAGTLCIGMASAAFAAEVTYTGEGTEGFEFIPGSSYTDTDLFENFKNVMPGDTLTETITIKNDDKSSDYIKVYMDGLLHDSAGNPISARVLNELTADERREDAELEYMHDFLSQLILTVKNGDNVVYSGAPNALEDGFEDDEPVFLAKINKGDSITLTAELEVPIELNNDYANRVGEVDWVFVIEEHDNGGGDGPGGGGNTDLTVRKVWVNDDAETRPDSITVALTRNGEPYGESVTLSDSNNWTYAWGKLNKNDKWTVVEQDVPDGYNVTYSTSGKVVTITNTDPDGGDPGTDPDPGKDPEGGDPGDGSGTTEPNDPVFTSDLTVVKEWDDRNNPDRPDSVTLQLYNGAIEVETIILTEADGWTYTWDDLAADGQWQVVEIDIADGYTPVYSAANGVVTITNTATLIDAGQMNWPIPVLGGLGALVLASGIMLMRKKKDDHAAE